MNQRLSIITRRYGKVRNVHHLPLFCLEAEMADAPVVKPTTALQLVVCNPFPTAAYRPLPAKENHHG